MAKINFRFGDTLHAQLLEASKLAGRSLNGEIEHRIERTFIEDRERAAPAVHVRHHVPDSDGFAKFLKDNPDAIAAAIKAPP